MRPEIQESLSQEEITDIVDYLSVCKTELGAIKDRKQVAFSESVTATYVPLFAADLETDFNEALLTAAMEVTLWKTAAARYDMDAIINGWHDDSFTEISEKYDHLYSVFYEQNRLAIFSCDVYTE